LGDAGDAVLVVGGYGVVGSQVAALVRRRHPDLRLVVAGRSAEKAARAAAGIGGATGAVVDVSRPHPLGDLRPLAVVSVVNDPGDHLLADAVSAGVPLLDVARWTDRVRGAAALLATRTPAAPVLLSSGWMAGIASTVAAGLAQQLSAVEEIDISVLYSLKDKAGPDSAEYMDRLATPFEVTIDGGTERVRPLGDSRRIVFPGGREAKVYRFDTPDQFTLPATTGARTVAARIAFDDAFTTSLLALLVRSGLWKLISGQRFTSLRRKLLYKPGPGACHEVVIDVVGSDDAGARVARRATISDPLGQTHLTAAATVIQLERLLGLDGASAPTGLVYPDTAPQLAAVDALRDVGVTVAID
jgi:saccharopine dehydrogenase-like NADP-dependent oxidoreductase